MVHLHEGLGKLHFSYQGKTPRKQVDEHSLLYCKNDELFHKALP